MRSLLLSLSAFLVVSLVEVGPSGVTATTAVAKKKKRKKKKRSTPKPVETAPTEATPVGTAAETADTPASAPIEAETAPTDDKAASPPEELLEIAQTLFYTLEYEAVLPYAEIILADERADIHQRLEAYWLQGSCLAIMNRQVDAEAPFRLLLRGKPKFEPPEGTPPKILAVFRKVQVEEQAIQNEMEALRVANIIAAMEVQSEPLESAAGGVPIVLRYGIKDAHGAVSSVSLQYRRHGEPAFSSIALQLDDVGKWHGEIPGEWTANDDGFELEYYLSTADENGNQLAGLGKAEKPIAIPVLPGQLPTGPPFYETTWFWSVIAGVVIASGVGFYFAYDAMTEPPSSPGGTVVFEE